MSRRRVVITGVGAVTPLGVGAESSFRRWVAGESGIEDGLGRCDEFSAADFLSRKEARRADRFTQLSIAAAQEALAQAGFQDGPAIDPGRVGCIEATGVGGISTIEEGQDALREKGGRSVSAQVVPMMMPNASAGTLALRYGLRGPSHCVASACAAGVRGSGRDLAVGHLSSLRRATRRFVMGEGAGVLVHEDAEVAAQRGQPELGEVLGFGASSDAHHITAPQPEGTGAAEAIRRALENAAIGPDDVDYVNAHGTCPRHRHAAQRPCGDDGAQGGARRTRPSGPPSPRPSR